MDKQASICSETPSAGLVGYLRDYYAPNRRYVMKLRELLERNTELGKTHQYAELGDELAQWDRRVLEYWLLFLTSFIVTAVFGAVTRPPVVTDPMNPASIIALILLGICFICMICSIGVALRRSIWCIRAFRAIWRSEERPQG